MKFFVTGATGFIGQAVIKQLKERGHSVLALARSQTSEQKLLSADCQVLRGDLTDLDILANGAKNSDGVIHLGFDQDFLTYNKPDGFKQSIIIDENAVTAIGNALIGTGKSFVAAGVYAYPSGVACDETSDPSREGNAALRQKCIDILLSFKHKNVNSSVVRIPPITHDRGNRMFAHIIVEAAKTNKFITRIGTGENSWVAAHRNDVATVFILAALNGKPGSTYLSHGETFKMGLLYEFLSTKLGLPIEDKSVEDAIKVLGFVAFILPSDMIISNDFTRSELGYVPKGIGLFNDLLLNY